MNWYFEEQGVSKGPFDEADFAQMIQRHEVPADALVWKPDMSEWVTVADINPQWLGKPAAMEIEKEKPAKTAAPEQAPKKKEKAPSSKPTPSLSEDAPVIEVAVPTEAPAATIAPPQKKLKPQAPAESPKEEKGGLLKRVFGFGKKK